MSVIDELLLKNQAYAAAFDKGDLPLPPRRKLAVLACMDSRISLFDALGLDKGDAHVIRNAGGIVTDDAVRSLAISQHLMGTEEIVLVHHTDCGMLKLTDEGFKSRLEDQTGERPDWPVGAFADLDESVRQSIARLASSPFIPHRGSIRGFVYDIESGRLREVT